MKQSNDNDRRYSDWYSVYLEEVRDRVKHWGDKRKRQVSSNSQAEANHTGLDDALFASGR